MPCEVITKSGFQLYLPSHQLDLPTCFFLVKLERSDTKVCSEFLFIGHELVHT